MTKYVCIIHFSKIFLGQREKTYIAGHSKVSILYLLYAPLAPDGTSGASCGAGRKRKHNEMHVRHDATQCITTQCLPAQCSPPPPPGERCRGCIAFMFVCCVRGVSRTLISVTRMSVMLPRTVTKSKMFQASFR